MFDKILKEAASLASNVLKGSGKTWCYLHPDETSVAQCKRCEKYICEDCLALFSKSSEKHIGLCRDCVIQVGIECSDHPSKQSVALCRQCGKGICQDCYDAYGVTAGDYAGTALCYECTAKEVAENVASVAAFRKRVKKERILMIVGAVIGAILIGPMLMGGFGHWVGWVLGVFVGASFLTIFLSAVSAALEKNENGERNILGGLFVAVFLTLVSPIISIYRFVERVRQIKQADEIIANDERALQQMRDYFEYTQIMEKSTGIDLAKLVEQDSELYGNTYAQSVLKNGEEAAQTELRQGAAQITANGEVIKNFDKRRRKKAEA